MKQLTSRQLKKLKEKSIWIGLIKIEHVPAFGAWLSCRHEYMQQSPDAGEILRAYRHGETLSIKLDEKHHTKCNRHTMILYYSFLCFCIGSDK